MNIVLRKEDGSTSVLLFVYNMVHTRTGGKSLYLSSLLEIMGAFGKAESATRMSLSRACKAGLLESGRHGKEVVYSITPLSMAFINQWNEGMSRFWKRYALRQQPWDGKWHTVTITPIDAGRKAQMAEQIEGIGYASIGGNQFLGPRFQLPAIHGDLKHMGLGGSVVSIHGELLADAGIDVFIETTFKLPQLRPQYIGFIEKYTEILSRIQIDHVSESFISEGRALPTLHQLGWDFLRISTSDAMLPKELYPEWEGEKAANLMLGLREILFDSAWRYLKSYK